MKVTRKGRPHHLTPYRRHSGGCKGTTLCNCPLWAHGRINGEFKRLSLKTHSEEAAKAEIRRLLDNDNGDAPNLVRIESALKTIESAAQAFIDAKKPPRNSPATHRIYKNATTQFVDFFAAKGKTNLRDITPELIRAMFTANEQRWKSARTKVGNLKVLRTWMGFCVESKWITESPAAGRNLSFKQADESARTPWVREEIDRILDAVETLTFKPLAITEEARLRARALVALLFAGGQRISDATFLRRADLDPVTGLLNYRVIKTRRKIEVPPKLHRAAVDILLALPGNGTFFFWDGDFSEACAQFDRGEKYLEEALPTGTYRRYIWQMVDVIERVLKAAGVGGSPHTFRDCFAVNLLDKDVPFLTVSKMLGHRNVAITERHYLNIVKAYRDKMSQSTNVLTYLDRYAS